MCVQDDIMHADLTVEENLLFSARFRLPAHLTHSQHLFFVERAIQVCAPGAALPHSQHPFFMERATRFSTQSAVQCTAASMLQGISRRHS